MKPVLGVFFISRDKVNSNHLLFDLCERVDADPHTSVFINLINWIPITIYQMRFRGAVPNAGIMPREGLKSDVTKYPRPKAFAITPTTAIHLLIGPFRNIPMDRIKPAA